MATADAQKAAGNCTIFNPYSPRSLTFSAPSVISGTYLLSLPGHLSSVNVIMIYSYAFSDNMEKGFGTSIFFAHINTTILNNYSNRDMYIEM